MLSSRRAAFGILVVLSALAAACGGSDAPPSPTATEQTQTVAPTPTPSPVVEPTSTASAEADPTAPVGPTIAPATPTSTATPPPTVTLAPGEPVTVNIQPGRDTTIYEEGTSLANGSGTYLFAGNTAAGNARRALLWFDVSAVVPAGATVTSALLTLNISKTRAPINTLNLHRLTATWGEGTANATGEEGRGGAAGTGDATWSRRGTQSLSWGTPGGDFSETASASAQVGASGKVAWGSTEGVVADVQAWVNAPESNAGWILIGVEAGSQTAKRFDSRESGVQSNAPILTIEYTP